MPIPECLTGALILELVAACRLLDGARDPVLVRELEVLGEPDLGTGPIIPVRARSEVVRERVVVVVIHLTPNEERKPPTASRGIAGRILLAAPPVCHRVDAEGHVPLNRQAERAPDEYEAPEFAHKEADGSRDKKAGDDAERSKPLVLKSVYRIRGEVLDPIVIGLRLPNDPADMGVPESLVDIIGILRLITEGMVIPVLCGPLHGRPLDRTRPRNQEEHPERPGGFKSSVRVVAVVAGGDRCRTENEPRESRQNIQPRDDQDAGDPSGSGIGGSKMYEDNKRQLGGVERA